MATTATPVDIDANLVTSHAEKESAAPTFKRGFGHHPLCSFVDHGSEGGGEPLAVMLRAGNAGSNTAADHIAIARQALAQRPGPVGADQDLAVLREPAVAIPAGHPTIATTDQDVLPTPCDEIPC